MERSSGTIGPMRTLPEIRPASEQAERIRADALAILDRALEHLNAQDHVPADIVAQARLAVLRAAGRWLTRSSPKWWLDHRCHRWARDLEYASYGVSRALDLRGIWYVRQSR